MVYNSNRLFEKEKELRQHLKNKRLIGELPFTQAEINSLKAVEAIQNVDVWAKYPNIAAYITVGIGNLFYKGGDLWSSFDWLDNSNIQNKWGNRFESFLTNHKSLESFKILREKDKRALRFLAPILAHGGIPQYCLDDFFVLITARSDPQGSGSDFIDDLKENKNWLTGLDVPIRRFLLYGGEVAESFVARVLILWDSHKKGDVSGDSGLPKRVAEKFGEWFAKNPPKERSRKNRLPHPIIKMSPGDLWVYLFLPRCDTHPEVGPNTIWYFNDKPFAATCDHEIPLNLRKNWNIRLNNRQFIFEGITTDIPAIFFDPTSGKMIRDPLNRRLPENLWVVYRDETTTTPDPLNTDRLDHWPGGYCVGRFDLRGYRSFVLGEQEFEVRRPSFFWKEDPVVQHVKAKSGLPVFYDIPDIRWEDKANFSLMINGVDQGGNIDIVSDDFKMWFDRPGNYKFELRKSLGDFIRKKFLYLPGFSIQFSPEVMWPGKKYVKIDVKLKNGHTYRDNQKPPFTAYQNPFPFSVETGGYKTELFVTIPKLQWRLIGLPGTDDALQSWRDQPIKSDIREIEKAEYPLLVARIDKTIKDYKISLVGRHGKIDPPPGKCSTVSNKGSWSFNLRLVYGQVLQSGQSEEYNIQVTENGKTHYHGKILSVRPHWNLQKVEAKWKRKDGATIQVHDGYAKIEGRWLVVNSLFQPWEKGTTHYLEPGKNRWESESEFAPDRYIVKAVHSPWGPPSDNRHVESQKETFLDVNKKDWPEIYNYSEEAPSSLESYTKSLFAHWYNNQLVRCPLPPKPPMMQGDISRFFEYLKDYAELSDQYIPQIPLNIFCVNPHSTVQVILSIDGLPKLWQKVLPSNKILHMEENLDELQEIEDNVINFGSEMESRKKQFQKSDIRKFLYNQYGLEESQAREMIFIFERFQLYKKRTAKSLVIMKYLSKNI